MSDQEDISRNWKRVVLTICLLLIVGYVAATTYQINRLQAQIESLRPVEVLFHAKASDTGEYLPVSAGTSQEINNSFTGIYSSKGHGEPPGIELSWVASDPVTIEVGAEGYVTKEIAIDSDFFEHLLARHEPTPWPKQKGISPQDTAKQIVRALVRRRREIYPNWRGRLLVTANRWCPGLVDRVMKKYG